MSKKLLFKLWDVSRSKKVFVAVDENSTNIYETLVIEGSDKMNLNGSKLNLEADGTAIDDDDTLKLVYNETIILLQPDEVLWQSSLNLFDALSDTVTYTSSVASPVSTPRSTPSNSDSVTTDGESRLMEPLIPLETPSCSKSVAYENTWLSFQIPWQKISNAALRDCEMGKRNSRSVSNVIHTTVDAIREISNNPSNKVIRIVANKIVRKYPAMFQDIDDDGTIMGDDGAIIVFSQLKERLKYLNRISNKRNLEINESDMNIPLKQKKKMLSAKADFTDFNEATKSMLEDTYPAQRVFLNGLETPTADDINTEWPILFSEQGIYWHFKKLMSRDINELIQNMLDKYDKVANFGIKKKFITTLSETEEGKLNDIIKVVSAFFSESIDDVICKITGDSDLDSLISLCIAYNQEDEITRYWVVMEQKKRTSCTSFGSALQQMFALYFNFNLEYPKSVSNSFEILQRYFLKICPEQGTKNRKSAKLKIKIVSFMNKLRDV